MGHLPLYHDKWHDLFVWLANRSYIRMDKDEKHGKIKGLFITRRTWTEPRSKQKSEILQVPTPQPAHIGYAFIDLPNIITKGDKWGIQLDHILNNLDWKGFSGFIRDTLGNAEHTTMSVYVNGRVIRRHGGAALYEQAIVAAREAGFTVVEMLNSAKDVDAQIIVDMMDVDFATLPKGSVVNYVLVSGDSDFLPALLRKQQHAKRSDINFDVAVVSWSQSVSKILLRESNARFIPLNTRIDLFQP